MKRMGFIYYIAAIVAAMSTGFVTAATINQPEVMPQASASLAVPDLHGFLDRVGQVSMRVSPTMNGMMIKSMIGMRLGDPGLSGIAPGNGLAVVALDPTNIFGVVELSEAQSETYTAAAIGNGFMAQYADGLLVVARSAEALAKGVGLASMVESALLSGNRPAMIITARPSGIVEKHHDRIQTSLDDMSAKIDAASQNAANTATNMPASVGSILEGELRLLVSLASQCDILEVSLAPDSTALVIDETVVPIAGTRLAALLNAPRTAEDAPKIRANILGGGMMVLDGHMGNPKALAAFFAGEAEKLMREMEIKDVDVPEITEAFTKWLAMLDGALCESFGFTAEGGFQCNYLAAVTDEDAALELWKNQEKNLATVFDLYKEMGVPVETVFRENVSTHTGIPIHQFEFNVSLEGLPQEQLALVEQFTHITYHLALFDGLMLCCTDEAVMHTTIDRLKDPAYVPAPIEARKAHPDNGVYYMDVDIGQYMAFVASIMPSDVPSPITPQVAAVFQGAAPVTAAGFVEEGLGMVRMSLPTDLITRYSQMVMLMAMQAMQQQQQAVPPSQPEQDEMAPPQAPAQQDVESSPAAP